MQVNYEAYYSSGAYLEALNPLNAKPLSENYLELFRKRQQLPVWSKKEEFLKLMDQHRCILVEAETGSGKTTQIPQWCVEWVQKAKQRGVVCCTQPRRVAAEIVARRVAEEMDVELGEHVGFTVRFVNACNSSTLLKYCTDGILLRQFSQDHELREYDVIVLDEVHERTMRTDVILGLVKNMLNVRHELRVVVMSASLTDSGNFNGYFMTCSPFCLKISGRSHPVDIKYNDVDATVENYFALAVKKVVEIHFLNRCTAGDILLFLTGEDEIEKACYEISNLVENGGPDEGAYGKMEQLICLPFYANQPEEEQDKIFEPTSYRRTKRQEIIGRRCIVATNIAETSMTIDGVVFVIDPGYGKRKNYDTKMRVESLFVQTITRASAIQRAGRAGRTRPGECHRLYTEECYNNVMKQVEPEIQHSNLANVVLGLLKKGIDLARLSLMDQPPQELLEQAKTLLRDLGAINERNELTALGEQIEGLPVEPQMARTLIKSVDMQCSNDVIIICAMMSAPRCFDRPRRKQQDADNRKRSFVNNHGDHMTLLKVFKEYEIVVTEANNAEYVTEWCNVNYLNAKSLKFAYDARTQLLRIMDKMELKVYHVPPLNNTHQEAVHSLNILRALVAGHFSKIAFFKPTNENGHRSVMIGNYYIAEHFRSSIRFGLMNAPGELHASSVLSHSSMYGRKPEWVLYNEAVKNRKGVIFLKMVSVIQKDWLMELAPHYFGRMPQNCELRKKLEMAPIVRAINQQHCQHRFFRRSTGVIRTSSNAVVPQGNPSIVRNMHPQTSGFTTIMRPRFVNDHPPHQRKQIGFDGRSRIILPIEQPPAVGNHNHSIDHSRPSSSSHQSGKGGFSLKGL